MSIADKITRLTTARNNIRTALAAKSVSASDHGFEDFATDIDSIAGSGTPIEIDTDAGMAEVLTASNVGKAYLFTGTTGTYTNGDVYVVEERM